MRPPPPTPLAALLLAVLSCQPAPAKAPSEEVPAAGRNGVERDAIERIFERNVVFMNSQDDSVLIVPWFFTATALTRSVGRRVQGALHRSGEWELFFRESWETPTTQAPWRIMPHGSMRIFVGLGEVVERIAFEEGPRQLEVILEEPLIRWNGARGVTFQLLEASLLLSNERTSGLILDMSRAALPGDPPTGDWALLASGDSLQIVLQNPEAGSAVSPGTFRAFARLDSRNLSWPDLSAEWTEIRSFQPARRDVPVAWRLIGPDREVEVELQVLGAHLEAGEGEGAQLPIEALFSVVGTVRFGELLYPVRGFLRHLQS